MGAVGALLIAGFKKRLSLELLKQSLDSTTRLSCFVLFILIGSTVFGLTFRAVEGDVWVEHLMGDLPGGELGFLIAVQILVFVLGFFLDFFEIAFIVIPLLVPVADKLGIDLVWFGVMIANEHANLILNPTVWFFTVLSEICNTRHCQDHSNLQGCAAFYRHATVDGCDHFRVS